MYAVIGASGYLGAYVMKHILKDTEEYVLATARKIAFKDTRRVKWIACDVTKPEDILRLSEISHKKCRGGGVIR